jgi:hypothetical protein
VAARDGRYEKLASGVVRDTRTGLEWYPGPDHNTHFYDAKLWTRSLKIDGGGWRLPTVEEVKSLYRKGAGTRNMPPLLETSGWFLWAGNTRVSSAAWDLHFNREYRNPYLHQMAKYVRCFAVRSPK